MSNARNLSKFKPSSSGLVETADIADDAVSTDQIANNAVINTSGAITTTGAFTSVGIDDNADATTITINTNEHVGIGTASPSTQLHIDEATSNSYATMRLEGNNRGGDIEMYQGTVPVSTIRGDQSGNLYFKTSGAYGNSSVSTKLTLGTAGDLTIDNGNLVIGTSGKGIDFSASSTDGTSVTSEVLSDFEIGTWQPSLTNGYAYNGLQAHYTKIGNVVYIYAVFYRNGFSTNSNTFIITNLPFTPDTSNKTNSNGLGHWSCYNGTTDRRHGMIDASNDGNVYFIQDGTKSYATYDGVAGSDGRGVAVKWFYYTAS